MSAPRVLIVVDNAMNIAIAEVVLLAEKIAVETAVDGLDAIHKAGGSIAPRQDVTSPRRC